MTAQCAVGFMGGTLRGRAACGVVDCERVLSTGDTRRENGPAKDGLYVHNGLSALYVARQRAFHCQTQKAFGGAVVLHKRHTAHFATAMNLMS